MPRALVAGCGYLGEATADLFHAAGWEIEGWTSSERTAARLGAKPYPVRARNISEALNGDDRAFDIVLQSVSSRGGDAAAYRKIYLQGATNLLSAFPHARLIFVGSTSVYAQRDGEWVAEESPAEPARATAQVLRETEELVLSHGGVVARLAGIYGPGRSFLLRNLLSDDGTIPARDRFINQVHRDDIAAALLLLATTPDIRPPRVFNVVDNEPMSLHAAYEWLAAQLHRRVPPVSETPPARKRGDSDKRVSNAKLRALGWSPRFPNWQIGMTESVLPAWQF